MEYRNKTLKPNVIEQSVVSLQSVSHENDKRTTSGGTTRRAAARAILFGAVAGSLLGAAAGCGLIDANIFDVTIKLQTQVYSRDFGMAMGKLPMVQCTGATDTCQQLATAVNNQMTMPTATGRCDTTTTPNQCVADMLTTLVYPVNLSQDSSFNNGIGNKAVDVVRSIELLYGIPVNTANFNIPDMMLYVGPQNAMKTTDSGVVFVDKIPAITMGQTVPPDSKRITIADGTPARTQLVGYIKNPKVPFVFIIETKPTVRGGDAVPMGKLELRITPTFTVGLPR